MPLVADASTQWRDALTALFSRRRDRAAAERAVWLADQRWRRLRPHLSLLNHPQPGEQLPMVCWALQLPVAAGQAAGRIKDHCQQAAELLSPLSGQEALQPLVEAATHLLGQIPLPAPPSPEARLLFDLLNLEDFGLLGWFDQYQRLLGAGKELTALALGLRRREQYGYWTARLEHFHFPQMRQLAEKRWRQLLPVLDQLEEELALAGTDEHSGSIEG